MAEEKDIAPTGSVEPTITFLIERDRQSYLIKDEETDEDIVCISGYDLDFDFNFKYLQTIEQIAAASQAFGRMFFDIIVKERIENSKLTPEDLAIPT